MRRIVIGVLAVLVLASGGLTAWVSTRDEPAPVKPRLSADGRYRVGTVGGDDEVRAVRAATKALPIALSVDYRSLDRTLKDATALMTPAFARDFSQTFKKTTETRAVDKKAITSALIRGAGIVGSVHDGKATVLVYLDQVLVSSKNKKAGDPLNVSQNRVHVSLRKVDGHWLVSDIEPF